MDWLAVGAELVIFTGREFEKDGEIEDVVVEQIWMPVKKRYRKMASMGTPTRMRFNGVQAWRADFSLNGATRLPRSERSREYLLNLITQEFVEKMNAHYDGRRPEDLAEGLGRVLPVVEALATS